MDIRRARKLMTVLSLVVMVLVLGACTCLEEISITSPTSGMLITNPVTVMGTATFPFEGQLEVKVWDSMGQQIGHEVGTVTGDYGQCGSFTVSVYFNPPSSDAVLIQVFTYQPFNGQLRHLSSTVVHVP